LHGADYEKWNPETDKLLPANYHAEGTFGKTTVPRRAFEWLAIGPGATGDRFFGMVTRVVGEKGFDISNARRWIVCWSMTFGW